MDNGKETLCSCRGLGMIMIWVLSILISVGYGQEHASFGEMMLVWDGTGTQWPVHNKEANQIEGDDIWVQWNNESMHLDPLWPEDVDAVDMLWIEEECFMKEAMGDVARFPLRNPLWLPWPSMYGLRIRVELAPGVHIEAAPGGVVSSTAGIGGVHRRWAAKMQPWVNRWIGNVDVSQAARVEQNEWVMELLGVEKRKKNQLLLYLWLPRHPLPLAYDGVPMVLFSQWKKEEHGVRVQKVEIARVSSLSATSSAIMGHWTGKAWEEKSEDHIESTAALWEVSSIEQLVQGDGAHKRLSSRMERNSKGIVVQPIPQQVFVDLDEIRTLERAGALEMMELEHAIDVERPSFMSNQHMVAFGVDSIGGWDIPIHTRYISASQNNESYGWVCLYPPLVWVQSNGVWSQVVLEHTMAQPVCSSEVCVDQVGDKNTIALRIPVGNTQDIRHVVLWTLGATILAAVGLLCGLILY